MPVRRSLVHALDVITYSGDSAAALEGAVTGVRLELHVSSGTYVRAIAEALGGHCTALRRVGVGPFGIDEAAPVEDAALLPVADALDRTGARPVTWATQPTRRPSGDRAAA